MLKKCLVSLVVVVSLSMWLDRKSTHAYSSRPPVFQASSPSMSSCSGNNCHGGELNAGGGEVVIASSFENNENVYTNGSLLDVTITINDPDAVRYGFQMVAMDANEVSVGNFITNDAANLTLQTSQNIEFISHFDIATNTENSYSFQYQAPDEDVGAITFYATGMAANGNGNPMGDDRYSGATEIVWTQPSDVANDMFSSISIFPNPSNNGLLTITGVPFEKAYLSIYDMQGELHYSKPCVQNETINLRELKAGMYLLKVANLRYNVSRKIILR